eukprot:TRINITY_DN16698_c0_g1_i1.p1 TRINITY_DN16698_c0_g1~~TRINITY_DN16698_c0_g1_i1.p1  ORF type:complete len:382 (+),score=31.70 TRINITY_DN16698_c0_g1_i1:25-1170(+)
MTEETTKDFDSTAEELLAYHLIYDVLLTHTLDWPSITCQWLPSSTFAKSGSQQNLLLGTQTDGSEPNHLIVMEVEIPDSFESESHETPLLPHSTQMVHEGDVNRARYMPRQPHLVATQASNGKINLFDLAKSEKILTLSDLETEGYGLAWSDQVDGHLAALDHSGCMCVWDLQGSTPVRKQKAHLEAGDGICWIWQSSNILATVADDRFLNIWDLRSDKVAYVLQWPCALNCVTSRPLCSSNQAQLLLGAADGNISWLDVRKLSTHSLLGCFTVHSGQVLCVEFAPFESTIFASSGDDCRVVLWDVELAKEAATDGLPAATIFQHCAHKSKVVDIAWNPNQEENWVIASVSDNNELHVWKPDNDLDISSVDTQPDPKRQRH